LQVFQVTGQTLQNNSDYYFGTQDNSLYASTDAGATFNGFGNEGAFLEIPRHLDAPTGAGQILVTVGFWVMFDGSNFDGTSPRSAKGWPQPPNAGGGEAPLVIEPGVYFEWGGNDLYLTVNPLPFLPVGPLTWTLVNGASIGNSRMGRPQWVGPPSNPVLFQGVTRADGTHGLVRIDGARTGTATVTAIDAGLVDLGVGVSNPANNLMFAVDPNNANHLIAADLGAQTMVTTKDGGAHWTPDPELTGLVTGGGQFRFSGIFSGNFNSGPSTGFALAPVVSVSIIQIDPNNGNHILVGTEDAGLFASLNGGDNWFSIPDSITTKASTSFFFDERTQNILVSTYARGLWQLTLPPVSACVFAPNRVTISDRTVVGAAVSAGTFLEVGASAVLDGDGTVGGNALGRSNGRVTGDLTLGGTLTTQQGFSVGGTLVQNDTPVIPTLVQRTFTVGTGSQTISTNVTLNPGDFGNVTISAGRTVTLNPGVFHFASLDVQPDANLVASGSSEVDVQGTFQLGDRADVISAPGLNVYSNGTFVRIGTDATFAGVLVAPNASVDVGSRTVVTGCLGAASVTFEPDVSLQSAGRTLPLGAPEAPTCTDGIKNDGETGVDCGGPSCPPCPTGTVRAVATVTADWGAGYCVELDVTNLSALPTTTWNVGLNLHGTNVTQSWNGTFSGATGNINVAPAFDWNQVIMPGATNNSVGFCANRPAGAGTATVTSASGSF
jgi:hypothetical protein